MFSFSFQPRGGWFVFELASGRTINKNLSKRDACTLAARLNARAVP